MQELIFAPPDNDSKGRVAVHYFIDISIYTKQLKALAGKSFNEAKKV